MKSQKVQTRARFDDQPKSSNNANETRAKFEEKTESPNNTNVAMVMFDDTPKSSNKANFTKQPATMELLMPMDWAKTSHNKQSISSVYIARKTKQLQRYKGKV